MHRVETTASFENERSSTVTCIAPSSADMVPYDESTGTVICHSAMSVTAQQGSSSSVPVLRSALSVSPQQGSSSSVLRAASTVATLRRKARQGARCAPPTAMSSQSLYLKESLKVQKESLKVQKALLVVEKQKLSLKKQKVDILKEIGNDVCLMRHAYFAVHKVQVNDAEM